MTGRETVRQKGESRISERAAAMGALKQRLGALVDAIPADAPVIYLDIPIHLNVGDLLIFAGTERLLARHMRQVTHRFSSKDYARFLDAVTDRHVLLMHGGGNLGDLWPEHESVRQDILRRFPHNRVVVFPQTVHFRDMGNAAACGAAYRDHPDCILFVRDETSRKVAERHMGVPCRTAPDAAHHLWRSGDIYRADAGGRGELVLRRTDQEAAESERAPDGIDWQDIITPADRAIFRMQKHAIRLNSSVPLQALLMGSWRGHRDRVIRRASTHFRTRSRIRTDRLHAVILGCLLGKEVIMEDNNYGKLSAYFDTWMPELIPRGRVHPDPASRA
ncbi:polysaccharide pyruvyl transferase family protein [Emcibacter sp. SYSU 3D8]|uniref:polysaccharide pyruvyl transferase family protein n=1 Tax=Emcibacter sp. SYSU 3D8 TaxID=3133969 RepID=UPI0031FEDF1E